MVQHHSNSLYVLLIALLFISALISLITQTLIPREHVAEELWLSKQEFLKSRPVATKSELQYHVVFSTSCSDQQHWESMVFFYHAYKVNQPGNVTRIVSGCKPEEAEQLASFHRDYISTMSDRFHLHVTPDFSRVQLEKGKNAYKYMNKPYGLRHWMEHGLGIRHNETIPPDLANGIVILMDPDMILLRPIVHDFTNEQAIWVESDPATRVVKHGFPIAQQDGYLTSEWMKLNFSYITGKADGEFVARPVWEDGPRHWNTGPPYLATVKDMYDIAVSWTEYAPRVLETHPHLFSEMYGYIISTVQLGLPHTLIKSIVVSTTETKDREGWRYIDELPDADVCDPPDSAPLPFALHYCKRYSLGKWFFSKYRLKKNIMNCEKALLAPPPRDLSKKFNYGVKPPRADSDNKDQYKVEIVNMSEKRAKREAFMLCAMTKAINEALLYHKKQKCSKDAVNLNKTYTVFDDPSNY